MVQINQIDQIKLFYEKIRVIYYLFIVFLGFIILIKNIFFYKNRILKGKYLHFKTLRKEYLEDKINGYFAMQQYFNTKLSIEEMDYILQSSDAYKYFLLLKAARGKYEFINKEFKTKITKKKYILPLIGYIISYLFLTTQIVFSNIFLSNITMCNYIILLILNLCICLPILINSIVSINEIACTRDLCGLTVKKNNKKIDIAKEVERKE